MPILNGFEAGERLKKLVPRAKLIVLTMTEDAEVAADVLRSWASGYLLKRSASSELVRAIQDVLHGKTFVTSHLAQNLLDKFVRDPEQRAKTLTPRQREILQLLAEGRSAKEIAETLAISPRTVEFHKYQMMETHGFHNSAELIHFAIKHGIVTI